MELEVSEWVTVVLPIGTLALGSVLTMTGQAFNDRRANERERRARREGFLAGNFEMHRAAMLEMQELMRDLYDSYLTEKNRRMNDGFYEYMKEFPLRNATSKLFQDSISIMEDLEAIKDAPSDEERKVLALASAARLKTARKEMEKYKDELVNLGGVLETLYPFWGELKEFITKLRLCGFRSGSNSVLFSSENLIEAVFKWSEYYQLNAHQEDLSSRVVIAYQEANRALSNALTFGPYDNYDAMKESEVKLRSNPQ
jgi:hypothetical protein